MAITDFVSKRMTYTLFLNTCFLLVIFSFMIVHFHTPEVVVVTKISAFDNIKEQECESLDSLGDYKAKCLYLKSNDPCASQGYIDYLYLFYCKFGKFPSLGYTLLFLWLLVLFYLLANTTSEYFCPSLESLSKLLRLSPTIAGVTLLSLGNGAPDVFSSLVSFQETGTRDIGFNTVLGGVSFVSCVVVGSVSIAIRQSGVQVAKSAFMRDAYFLLFVLLALFGILIYGKINFLGAIGFTLIYVVSTKMSGPPNKCLFPWLAGGFVMSVTWSYIIAQELVGLLVSIGYICGISPSMLGLTVLAWGNSIGDLMTNLTMALNGGQDGAQVAMSGCYAGPIFNTLIGLGLSLVTCTWSEYPQAVVIPRDPYLWETMVFLVAGLVWALVVLIKRDMKLDGLLGGGLLSVYFLSLFIRLIQTKGSLQ
eukprot:XP_025984505.1 cation/calcium exchanger 2 [Glycine max]